MRQPSNLPEPEEHPMRFVPYEPSPFIAPPPGGELQLGWTGLEGVRVRVEVTYTTPAYSLTTTGGTLSEEPKTTDYPARTDTEFDTAGRTIQHAKE